MTEAPAATIPLHHYTSHPSSHNRSDVPPAPHGPCRTCLPSLFASLTSRKPIPTPPQKRQARNAIAPHISIAPHTIAPHPSCALSIHCHTTRVSMPCRPALCLHTPTHTIPLTVRPFAPPLSQVPLRPLQFTLPSVCSHTPLAPPAVSTLAHTVDLSLIHI